MSKVATETLKQIPTHGSPRKYVPLHQYQSGSVSPPPIVTTQKKETPMPTATPPAPPKPTGPPQRKAGVKFVNQDGQDYVPETGEPNLEQGHDPRVLQGSRPVLVKEETEPVPTEASPEFSDEQLTKLRELKLDPTSPAAKAYLSLQSKLGEQGTTITALNQQVQDMLLASSKATEQATLQPVVTPPDISVLQKELNETLVKIKSSLLDDPTPHLKRMAELSSQIAETKILGTRKDAEQQAMLQATRALNSEYPGLVVNKADAAYVDALVEGMKGGPTLPNYKSALEDFAKLKGWTKPSSSATPNADVEAMKAAAATQAPPAATGKSKGKIWRRYELEQLQIKYPEKYLDMQPEIMAAYREGRVR